MSVTISDHDFDMSNNSVIHEDVLMNDEFKDQEGFLNLNFDDVIKTDDQSLDKKRRMMLKGRLDKRKLIGTKP